MGQLDGLTGWGTTYKLTGPTENVTVLQVNNRAILKVGRASGGQTVSIPNSTTIISGARLMVIGDDSHMSRSNTVTVTDGVYSATLDAYAESRELMWTGSAWATASGGSGVTDHGDLTGLAADDHAQYVHTGTARTISAQHTFNPPGPTQQPFLIGANGTGLVTRLNADLLDGQHGSYYTDLGNATGSLAFSKIDTSNGVDFGNSIKVGTAGGDPAVYADGDLTLFALSGDLILAAQSFLVFRDQTNYWGRLSKEYGLEVFLDNTVDTAEHKLGISYYALTTSGASGSRFKVDPVSLVLGTIDAPELALGLASSKVPLEFKVVGADNVLTLSQDSIQSSGNLQLSSPNALKVSNGTIEYATLTHTDGLSFYVLNAGSEVVGACALDETGLLTQDLVNTRSGKLAPNALTIGTSDTPEISLGLTTSKVPLEFKVVGADNVLTLSQDSIQSSGNLQLKDANGTSQLTIATTGTTFAGVPRYGINPLGPGDGSKWSSYFEDFRNTPSATAYVFAGGLQPIYGGTGAAVSTVVCGTTEIGVFRTGVGTTSTGYGGLRNGNATWLCFGLGRNYIKTRVRLPNLSTEDDRYVVRLGWNDHATGGAPTDGAYFRYTDSENDGRWTCVCVSNGVESTADSDVAVAANTWAKLEIEINAAASSAVFKIDGNTVATITTNIPSGGARGTMTGLWIVKSAGTSNRYMDIDYVHEVNEFTSLNR